MSPDVTQKLKAEMDVCKDIEDLNKRVRSKGARRRQAWIAIRSDCLTPGGSLIWRMYIRDQGGD